MTHAQRADAYVAELGFEAYRVGGSVRDELLGRRSKDTDYVVCGVDLGLLGRALFAAPGGKPTAMKLRDSAVQFGWRKPVRGLGLLEIALPRTDRPVGPTPEEVFGNQRHRFEIVVDPDLPLEEDARRRDLTINAIYRNVATGEIVDPVNGGFHLSQKLLATTHPDSFRDDPLRTLRALRFVATLGFDLGALTKGQMREHASAVTGLTGKGVSGTALDELCRLLMGRHVEKSLGLARDTDVLGTLLPEIAPMLGYAQESKYHDLTTDEHTFRALDAAAGMDCPLRVRLALLFHDAGKPQCAWRGEDDKLHYYRPSPQQWERLTDDPATVQEFCDDRPRDHEEVSAELAATALTRLNCNAKLKRDVVTLVRKHMVSLSGRTRATKVRKWRCELGDDLLADLLRHRLCNALGKGTVNYEAVSAVARLEAFREEAVRAGVPTSIKDLKIDGHDAMAAGLEGREIGRVLRIILHEVVSQPTQRMRDRDWQKRRLETLARRPLLRAQTGPFA